MAEGQPKLLLTVKEAAQLLQLGRDRTWELVHSGKLPAIWYGPRTCRVPRHALEAYVQRATQQQAG